MVTVLAGGTGGAKLARGMLDEVGPDELVVVANTADDTEVYGVHVSPDPDILRADRYDDVVRAFRTKGAVYSIGTIADTQYARAALPFSTSAPGGAARSARPRRSS